jgi:hypothetical protein
MATQADGDNDDLPHAEDSPSLSTITGFATNKHRSAKECGIGKQRAVPQEEEDVTQAAADESQWRAGVNRQSQPTAHEHQLAALTQYSCTWSWRWRWTRVEVDTRVS